LLNLENGRWRRQVSVHGNRKLYAQYQIVTMPMTLSDSNCPTSLPTCTFCIFFYISGIAEARVSVFEFCTQIGIRMTSNHQSDVVKVVVVVPIFRSTVIVDLIKRSQISVRLCYICTYVCPSTKRFFEFSDIWHVGRGPWVMHDAMQYDPIQHKNIQSWLIRQKQPAKHTKYTNKILKYSYTRQIMQINSYIQQNRGRKTFKSLSTKCRHKLLFNSAVPEPGLWMEYFIIILPYSYVLIIDKDLTVLLSHMALCRFSSKTVISVDQLYKTLARLCRLIMVCISICKWGVFKVTLAL